MSCSLILAIRGNEARPGALAERPLAVAAGGAPPVVLFGFQTVVAGPVASVGKRAPTEDLSGQGARLSKRCGRPRVRSVRSVAAVHSAALSIGRLTSLPLAP